jgi:hypothetical protein
MNEGSRALPRDPRLGSQGTHVLGLKRRWLLRERGREREEEEQERRKKGRKEEIKRDESE